MLDLAHDGRGFEGRVGAIFEALQPMAAGFGNGRLTRGHWGRVRLAA